VSRQLAAELLKIRTTRTTAGLVLGMVVLVLLFALLGGLLMGANDIAQADNQRQLLAAGEAATLFAALVGLMLVTSEYRYGTIRPTLLYEPRRGLLVSAKLLAGLLMGLTFGAIAEALALAIGLIILAGRDVDRVVSGGELARLAFGSVGVTALWAVLGVAIGGIVRHQVGAIVSLLAYLFVAENLIFGLVPKVGRYLPGPSGQAVIGSSNNSDLVHPAWGAAFLTAYAVVLAVVAVVLTDRRDVD